MKKLIKDTNRGTVFILQIEDDLLKILKINSKSTAVKFTRKEDIKIAGGIENSDLAIQVRILLRKLDYRNQPLIFCLPRKLATCHYLKVPSKKSDEIENMIAYRAPRLLPYEISELITGYEIIRTDNQGYSHINLTIIHRKIIDKFTQLFNESGAKITFFALSPYGTSNLFFYDNQRRKELAILIDADLNRTEVAVVRQEKLVFSRSFKTPQSGADLESSFLDEIEKTCDSYKKETGIELPENVYVFAEQKLAEQLIKILVKDGSKASMGQYSKKITPQSGSEYTLLDSKNSYVSLLGVALKRLPQSLNLLPLSLKKEMQKADRLKEILGTAFFLCLILAVWFLAGSKNFENKRQHLRNLEDQLQELKSEAAPLEQMERRLRILRKQSEERIPIIDFIYGTYNNIPEGVYLRNLILENQELLILKGEAPELNKVFEYVSRLEKSSTFKAYEVKVKQATKKNDAAALISFEIICQKK